jgi:hypothetical protein
VADQTLIDLAAKEPPSIRGTVSMVTEFGIRRAARTVRLESGIRDDAAVRRILLFGLSPAVAVAVPIVAAQALKLAANG